MANRSTDLLGALEDVMRFRRQLDEVATLRYGVAGFQGAVVDMLRRERELRDLVHGVIDSTEAVRRVSGFHETIRNATESIVIAADMAAAKVTLNQSLRSSFERLATLGREFEEITRQRLAAEGQFSAMLSAAEAGLRQANLFRDFDIVQLNEALAARHYLPDWGSTIAEELATQLREIEADEDRDIERIVLRTAQAIQSRGQKADLLVIVLMVVFGVLTLLSSRTQTQYLRTIAESSEAHDLSNLSTPRSLTLTRTKPLRSAPHANAPEIGRLPEGAQVEQIGTSGQWLLVVPPVSLDAPTAAGWISKRHVQ